MISLYSRHQTPFPISPALLAVSPDTFVAVAGGRVLYLTLLRVFYMGFGELLIDNKRQYLPSLSLSLPSLQQDGCGGQTTSLSWKRQRCV